MPNLRGGLKQVLRATTRLGFSRRTAYVGFWQDTYKDPQGAHPATSNLFWTSNQVDFPTRRLVMKVRTGTLYNQKLAKRYKRSHSDRCPLCGQPDSVGHILGGCKHRRMKGKYISRHDKAVLKIHRALQKGPRGGHYCLVDAGTMTDVLNEAANGKRLEDWMLPDIDPAARKKMRPDILRITGLRSNATQEEITAALQQKDKHVVQIIEVGYGPDTRWKDTLERKQNQHTKLKEALETAGWKVEVHCIILGNAGTMYNHTLTTLQTLGLDKTAAVKLMGELHIHTVACLRSIILARRRREHNQGAEPPDKQGVG